MIPIFSLPTVWIISNEQLLAWVRDPVSIANLDSFDALKCSTPAVTAKICDGIPENEAGLLSRCPFPDFPFFTCVCSSHVFLALTVANGCDVVWLPRDGTNTRYAEPRASPRREREVQIKTYVFHVLSISSSYLMVVLTRL
jgi:hypothetical protein